MISVNITKLFHQWRRVNLEIICLFVFKMAKLSSLIDKIVSLETEKSRKISAFVGAIVGDAACIHLEWIYDETTLTEKLSQHSVGKGLKQEKDSNETTNVRISRVNFKLFFAKKKIILIF